MDVRIREILLSLQHRCSEAVRTRRDPRAVRAHLKCLANAIRSSMREEGPANRPILVLWREVLAQLDPEHSKTYRVVMQEDDLRMRIDEVYCAVSAATEVGCDKKTVGDVLAFCQLLADQVEYALQQEAETDSVLPTRLGRPALRLVRAS